MNVRMELFTLSMRHSIAKSNRLAQCFQRLNEVKSSIQYISELIFHQRWKEEIASAISVTSEPVVGGPPVG